MTKNRIIRHMLLWFLVVAAILTAWGYIVASRFGASIEADQGRVRASRPSASANADLPPLLRAYVARANLQDSTGKRWVRIEQQGEMRLKPDGDWKPFTAVQHFAVSEPSFVWRASFNAFQVVDSVVAGVGRLEARVFGVFPVAKASGLETTRAQLLRYLAEVVWVPHAILGNPNLSWQQLNASEVLGILEHQGQRVELRFHFDANGDVERVEGVRDREVEGQQVLTPWIGVFSDYQTLGGIRVPTHGEVRWILDSGAFVYWRGTVSALLVN